MNWIDPAGLENRKPGKTPPRKWPDLPDNLGGKKPKWNPDGCWEGKGGEKYTWDDRSHGTGIDRGDGPQDGHWDAEESGKRYDRNGDPLGGGKPPIPRPPLPFRWPLIIPIDPGTNMPYGFEVRPPGA